MREQQNRRVSARKWLILWLGSILVGMLLSGAFIDPLLNSSDFGSQAGSLWLGGLWLVVLAFAAPQLAVLSLLVVFAWRDEPVDSQP